MITKLSKSPYNLNQSSNISNNLNFTSRGQRHLRNAIGETARYLSDIPNNLPALDRAGLTELEPSSHVAFQTFDRVCNQTRGAFSNVGCIVDAMRNGTLCNDTETGAKVFAGDNGTNIVVHPKIDQPNIGVVATIIGTDTIPEKWEEVGRYSNRAKKYRR